MCVYSMIAKEMLSHARSVARKEKFISMAAVSVITAQSEEVWYIYIYQTEY